MREGEYQGMAGEMEWTAGVEYLPPRKTERQGDHPGEPQEQREPPPYVTEFPVHTELIGGVGL